MEFHGVAMTLPRMCVVNFSVTCHGSAMAYHELLP